MTTFPEVREAPASTCCTCGFKWRTGTHGGHSCAEQMGKTIDAQAAEIERLHAGIADSHKGIERLRAVCIDYAIIVGELSKGLTQDDPLWADILRAGAALEQTK